MNPTTLSFGGIAGFKEVVSELFVIKLLVNVS